MVFLGTGSSAFVPFGVKPAAFFGFGPLGLPPEFLGFGFGGNGSVGPVLGGCVFLGSVPGGCDPSPGSSIKSPGCSSKFSVCGSTLRP